MTVQCLEFYLVNFIINWFAATCYGEIKMNIIERYVVRRNTRLNTTSKYPNALWN